MPSHRDTARHFPWDRVPTSVGGAAAAGPLAVPVVRTTLVSYTVPSGRKASIDALFASVLVNVAGAGGTWVRVGVDRNSGGTYMNTVVHGAAVGNAGNQCMGQAGWVQPGETVNGWWNASVAGIQATYFVGFALTECQA